MRIPSGVTDQYVYFVAVDATDFTSRETGLSSFTVYRSRNGGAAAAMTTPTINETDNTNMPGVYELLLDEDMTIDSGDDSQAMVFHITHAGMAPVTLEIELYRAKISAGETLTVSSGSANAAVQSVANNAITAAAIANGAIDAATFAADVDAEILSYIVDDATRIDASALNTASGAVGSNGSGLTEAGGTGDHLTAVPWNSAWDAEVQSEVEDALTAARSEPTGVPAANASLVDKVSFLFNFGFRNKVEVTASKKTFYDDGDAAEFEKDLSDDGTTYTESEANSV